MKRFYVLIENEIALLPNNGNKNRSIGDQLNNNCSNTNTKFVLLIYILFIYRIFKFIIFYYPPDFPILSDVSFKTLVFVSIFFLSSTSGKSYLIELACTLLVWKWSFSKGEKTKTLKLRFCVYDYRDVSLFSENVCLALFLINCNYLYKNNGS